MPKYSIELGRAFEKIIEMEIAKKIVVFAILMTEFCDRDRPLTKWRLPIAIRSRFNNRRAIMPWVEDSVCIWFFFVK